MLTYDKKDQYHEITLKDSGIKITGEILSDNTNAIRINVIKTAQALPINGEISIRKQDVVQITPVTLDNTTTCYICTTIYPKKIKGIANVPSRKHGVFKKLEYYAIQVDSRLNEDRRHSEIQAYLDAHVHNWSGYYHISKEGYEEELNFPFEARLMKQYGEDAEKVMNIMSFLSIEERFQSTIASKLLYDLDKFKPELRELVSSWIKMKSVWFGN